MPVVQDKHVSKVFGKYSMSINIGNQKRVTVSHRWKSSEFNALEIQPCPYVHKTIADAAIKYLMNHKLPVENSIDVVCYTGAVVRGYRYRVQLHTGKEESGMIGLVSNSPRQLMQQVVISQFVALWVCSSTQLQGQ